MLAHGCLCDPRRRLEGGVVAGHSVGGIDRRAVSGGLRRCLGAIDRRKGSDKNALVNNVNGAQISPPVSASSIRIRSASLGGLVPGSIYSLTAEELASDIQRLLLLYRDNEIHEAVLRQVLKGACWWISNSQGKKDACDLWSEKALALRNASSSWQGLGLVHEHVIPRNVIEEQILALETPSVTDITELLLRSRVCVVTAEEDKCLREKGLRQRLPSGTSLADGGVARYLECGIKFSEVPYRAGTP